MLISMEESTLKRVSSKIQIAIPGDIFLLVDTRRGSKILFKFI